MQVIELRHEGRLVLSAANLSRRRLLQVKKVAAGTAHWYDDRSPGLGADLVDAVRAATNLVTEAAERWRLIRALAVT